MGNTCNQLDAVVEENIEFIKVPRESKQLQRIKEKSQIRSPEEDAESLRYQARLSMSKINVKLRPLNFDVLNRSFLPVKMKVDLSNDHKVLKQYQDKENRFNIYSLEIGHRQSGVVNLSFVNVINTNTLSAIAFAGEYNGAKKYRGVYFFLTATEAFMFQGEFGDKENIGLKITFGKGIREKVWGTFNSKFQASGKCLLQGYYENEQQMHEEHFFEGMFANGRKEGKGILKIKEAKKLNFKNLPNEYCLDYTKINEIKKLIDINDGKYEKLSQRLDKLIANSAKYSPIRPESVKDSEYRTIIDSEWKNNAIQGIAIQTWPRLNFHFQGMYRNSQRNGYGEEYADQQLIAKGFYHNGIMETDKDNELQLLGFRYNPTNQQWRRDKQ